MATSETVAAWIALFFGIYALAAAIGEWRTPGTWAVMLKDFERKAGLQFLTGIVLLMGGAAIYLVTPWRPDDWLHVVVTIIGGGMALEGAVMIAFGEPYMRFARALLGDAGRFWVLLSAAFGIGFIVVALMRL